RQHRGRRLNNPLNHLQIERLRGNRQRDHHHSKTYQNPNSARGPKDAIYLINEQPENRDLNRFLPVLTQ
ncbi:hypothetical protein OAE58_00935, partial [Akkermansiaceae bacterium]|nr:hypothetical protein [Akkermansiaceae bacterium]